MFSCLALLCPPIQLTNGALNNTNNMTYLSQTSVNATCTFGYCITEPNDVTVITTCLANGTWTIPSVNCECQYSHHWLFLIMCFNCARKQIDMELTPHIHSRLLSLRLNCVNSLLSPNATTKNLEMCELCPTTCRRRKCSHPWSGLAISITFRDIEVARNEAHTCCWCGSWLHSCLRHVLGMQKTLRQDLQ